MIATTGRVEYMAEILIRRPGDNAWHSPSARTVGNEAELRDLLAESPELLPGPEDVPLVAVTEFSVKTGYVDIVAVGSDGSILVTECKLKANPEIRRQVLGQVLSYAGAIWGMSFEEFDHAFERRSGQSLLSLGDVYDDPEWDADGFRKTISSNLKLGAFRVVVAVDEITEELKQSISYLNSHTTTAIELLGLEVAYVRDGEVEMLIPVVYGEEAAATKRAERRHTWTEEEFWEHADDVSTPDSLAAIRALHDWAIQEGGSLYWGNGKLHPSMTAWVQVDGTESPIWSCYLADNDATLLGLNFDWLRTRTTEERMANLAEGLRSVPEAKALLEDLEEREYRRRPSLRVAGVLTRPEALEGLLEAYATLVATVP